MKMAPAFMTHNRPAKRGKSFKMSLIVFLHAIQVTETMAIIQNLWNVRVSHSHIMAAVMHTSTYSHMVCTIADEFGFTK